MISPLEPIISQKQTQKKCTFGTYACLEQPQTLDFLKYLKLSEGPCLNFNSQGNQDINNGNKQNRKTKKFAFNGVFDRSEKLKYQCGKMIKEATTKAISGQNQTFFIYGTEQNCKDKILVGQSQNPGIFLCFLSQLFNLCHEKALQDHVTIKFSCSLFNKAKFIDIFGGAPDCDIQFKKDIIQGGLLHSVPEIIIRNVKTGLKLLNIALKQLTDRREQDFTQNFIISLKLQLDCKKVNDETEVYCLSKVNFIKLANPSINSSLKGVNKNNVWFVNLLNFIQAPAFLGNKTEGDLSILQIEEEEKCDQFTTFLKENVFKTSHHIYCFVSITNKMTSNQCLTALLFANHVKNLQIQSNKFIIELPKLNAQNERLFSNVYNIFLKNQSKTMQMWMQYLQALEHYIEQFNYLQFEYSLVIGEACQRLNKYIFTQELQDFFYAKKTSIQSSEDLTESYQNVYRIFHQILNLKKKILAEIGERPDKHLFQRALDLQFSLTHHFLLEDFTKFKQVLEKQIKVCEQKSKVQPKVAQIAKADISSIKANIMSRISEQSKKKQQKVKRQSLIMSQNDQKSKLFSKSIMQPFRNDSKGKRNVGAPIDNLQGMFKNKNVGVGNKKIKQNIH